MAIPSKRAPIPANGKSRPGSGRDQDALSKRRKRKEEEEDDEDLDDEEDEEEDDEDDDEDEAEDEEDDDEEEDEEEDGLDEQDLENDDFDEDDDLDDVEDDEDFEDEDFDEDDDLDEDDEEEGDDEEDEDDEEEDFDDEDDEEDDEDDEEDEDDEDFDDEDEEEEDEPRGRRRRASAKESKKGSSAGKQATPAAAVAAGAVLAGDAAAKEKDATVRTKPVSSPSSARRSSQTKSKRADDVAGSRRFEKKSDKLKLAMILGCFLLLIACVVMAGVVLKQRWGKPEDPNKENLEFNLGERLARQVGHGDKAAAEGRTALEEKDFATTRAKLKGALTVYEAVIQQIEEIRRNPKYSGEDFSGYEVKAQEVNKKIYDLRLILGDLEMQEIRERARANPIPPSTSTQGTQQDENYDPDYEEQMRQKALRDKRKKEEEAKKTTGENYDPDYEEQMRQKKLRDEAKKKEAEAGNVEKKVEEKDAPETTQPAPPEKPAAEEKEKTETVTPPTPEPAPEPKSVLPAEKNEKGELKVEDFQ